MGAPAPLQPAKTDTASHVTSKNPETARNKTTPADVTARASIFSFANSYPLGRLLTPNGDGKNDVFIFKCYSPKDSMVTGRIFSLAGRTVAKMTLLKQSGFDYYLKWDPNSGGNKVPGGIYIYQIEVEDQAYTGTVVVIR